MGKPAKIRSRHQAPFFKGPLGDLGVVLSFLLIVLQYFVPGANRFSVRAVLSFFAV